MRRLRDASEMHPCPLGRNISNNHSFSSWKDLLSKFHKDLFLGHFYLNIFVWHVPFKEDLKFSSYADWALSN